VDYVGLEAAGRNLAGIVAQLSYLQFCAGDTERGNRAASGGIPLPPFFMTPPKLTMLLGRKRL